MKLEMTTEFLHLIEPGTYGTNLGDAMENLDENYFDDFRNAIVEYGIEKINEMLSEDSIVALFGECKAENRSLNSANDTYRQIENKIKCIADKQA